MESHKRILAILFIVSGVVQTLILLAVYAFVGTLLPFIASEIEPDAQWVLGLIGTVVPALLWGMILLMALPSMVGGIALLQNKTWALTLLLILGCFKLFSFPIGTALGIYTIWVYAEDNKAKPAASA
jgi:hypothetical protein